MKKFLPVLLLIIISGLFTFFLLKIGKSKNIIRNNSKDSNQSQKVLNYVLESNNAMKLTSTVFTDNTKIPAKYTCDGLNINPPLVIEEVPETAKSLVLIVEDPDAPAKVWTHWVMFNMPTTTTKIDEASLPSGALNGVNDFGKTTYGGPCPPSGTHRYNFTLYALNSDLNLEEGATKDAVLSAIKNHIEAQDTLVGLYSR